MRRKKLTALVLTGVMAASLPLGGCGDSIQSDAIVATFGEQELTLGYLNFMARYTQASYDSIYLYYYGDNYWENESYADEDGNTLEDIVKDAILEDTELACALAEHLDDYGVEITDEEIADMQAAGEQFLADNTNKTIRIMGAEADYVAQMLYYTLVERRMEEAIEAEVGEDLDIADYARRTFSYIRIDKVGYTNDDDEYVEYTEEELDDVYAEAEVIAQAAAEDYDQAADDYGLTIYSYSYGEDEEESEDGEEDFRIAVYKEADLLHEGEVSGVIEGDNYYYIIRLDSEDDEAAAETAMQEASDTMKSDHFDEVSQGYIDEEEFTVDEELWATVRFDRLFEMVYPEEEE